jgi:hypothetical protein
MGLGRRETQNEQAFKREEKKVDRNCGILYLWFI